MNSGIYSITNMINGKRYVGSSVNFKKRWRDHQRELSCGNHHSQYLQHAFKKYGVAAFEFKPLLICESRDLLFYEQRCIDAYSPEYNMCMVAGSHLGVKRSLETRAKISAATIGHKRWLGRKHTEETIAKMRGREFSQNTLRLMSETKRGKKLAMSTRAKISESLLGNTRTLGYRHTSEARMQMSASRRGKKKPPFSEEHRANIGATSRGRIPSIETRAKIAAAGRGRRPSDETRLKLSAWQKGRKLSLETRHKIAATLRARNSGEK